MGKYYPIKGIQVGRGPNGEVPIRMEVDEWWDSKDPIHINQQTLVFTAMNKMYDTSPHDKLSWYQICGIHNQPIVSWDDTGFQNKNYCFHSEVNFPTWHRPYNALLEQRIHEVMIKDVVPMFPKSDQAELIEAANLWRFPFWDWAAKRVTGSGPPNYDVPKLIREKEVEVRVAGGTARVPNPFYAFRMKDDIAMGDPKLAPDVVTREPYNRTKATSRHPYVEGAKEDSAYRTEEDADGIVNNDGVKDELQAWKHEGGGNLTGTLRDWFYRILLICPFESFATGKSDFSGGMSGKFSSIEDIHDVLHDWGGGTFGHMGAPAVGAMEPLFWLHHVNIDRMMSIWGGLHPKEARQWLENAPDAVVNLIPFRTNQYGDYHTPRACWDTESLGYAYPETKRWEKKYQTNGEFDEDKLQVELSEFLNKRYNSAASAQKKAALTTTREEPADKTITDPNAAAVDEAPKLGALIGGQEVKGAVISAIPEGKTAEDLLPDILEGYDYVANVIYEKYALDGHPFTIRFFIGNVPEGNNNAITQALTQVGEIYNFVDPVDFEQGGCENCAKQKRDRLQVTGQIPLTNALLTRFKQKIPHETESGEIMTLTGMDPEQIVPFLQAQFHWRVTDREGVLIDKTRITGLKVAVAAGKGAHFNNDPTKLSKFGDYKILYDITADASSGTGAAPQDNLFSHNKGLTGLVSVGA